MNERTRILRLVEEGKITPDEAAMLLEALAEVEAPRFNLPVPPQPPVPPEPPGDWGRGRRGLERLTEAARQLGVRAEEIGRRVSLEAEEIGRRVAEEFRKGGADEVVMVSYPSHLRWLKVKLLHGDLEVYLDPALTEPEATGAVELVENEEGLEVRPVRAGRRKAKGDFHANDLELRLPEGWGLACEVMHGDLRVEGLPYVRGSVRSGDTTLKEVRGIDLEVTDDLHALLCLTDGQHHLSVLNGDAHIVFLDSSVKLEGKLLNGELESKGYFEQQRHKVLGVVGDGHAHLRVEVLGGDLILEDRSRQDEPQEV